MSKRISLVLVVFVLFASLSRAGDPTLWGTVTRVDPGALQLRLHCGETAAVSLTADTQYRKWIMAKPWAQDPHATARAIGIGSRVGIDFTGGRERTARTVWIVVR
jgi:hypothetical protein